MTAVVMMKVTVPRDEAGNGSLAKREKISPFPHVYKNLT